jgi:hypothetical protein
MIAAVTNWWATHSPFALNERLHGPMRRSDKVVFIITATVAIWLVLFLLAAFYVMGGL